MKTIRFYTVHYQPIYTGAGKSLEKLINSLDKEKFKIEILTAFRKDLKRVEYKDNYKIIRLGLSLYSKTGYLNTLGKVIFSLSSAIYCFFNKEYDIIHFNGVGHVSFPVILTTKLFRKSIVNKITGIGDDDPKKLSQYFAGRIIIKLLERNSAHWIISNEIRDNCISYTKWPSESLYLVPNPVEMLVNTYDELLKLRKENQKSEKISFIFIGVLNFRKGINILLDIWEKSDMDANLVLCGPLGNDELLNKRITTINDARIIWKGTLEKKMIIQQYLQADYFLFPSTREGLPNVVLESMSLGLPVIANKIHGVTDFLFGENERGISIEHNSIEDWISIITKLIKNEISLENQRFKAFKWIEDNASSKAVSKKMESIYSKLR